MKTADIEALGVLLALAPAGGRADAVARIGDEIVRAGVGRTLGNVSCKDGRADARRLLEACARVLQEEMQ